MNCILYTTHVQRDFRPALICEGIYACYLGRQWFMDQDCEPGEIHPASFSALVMLESSPSTNLDGAIWFDQQARPDKVNINF